jgi:hypothetical protein
MKRRFLTCFAVVLSTLAVLAVLAAVPAGVSPRTPVTSRMYVASVREPVPGPVPVERADSVSAPAKHAADAFGTLAGAMVAAAGAAFAGTAMVRRRKGVQR